MATPRRVRLTRIHIEEDAGKNIHAESAQPGRFQPLGRAADRDRQRARPPLRRRRRRLPAPTAHDSSVRRGVRRQDGGRQFPMRLSTSRSASAAQRNIGVRTEIKNLNSFRFVEDAIEYEVDRQIELLSNRAAKSRRKPICGIPRAKRRARCARKSIANDYRYFPEPDLPPLIVPAEMVEQFRASMPELPADRRARYVRESALPNTKPAC